MPSALGFCLLIASRKRLSHQAGRVAAVIGLVVILTAITASLSLRLAEQFGRLSIPPTYDDVAYFLAAAQWLNAAPSQGLAANFYGLLHQHAPFSTLTAAIGFTLRPNSFLGPYAINAVIILAFLLDLAGLLWRGSLVDIVTCLVGAACVPMLWQTMTEARPDLPWGLALGLAIGAILYRPLLQRSRWSIFRLGVLCGLASAIKPTAFPASFVCIGLAAGVQLACECLECGIQTFRAAVARAGLPALLLAAGLLAGAVPIFGIELVRIIRYILSAMIRNRDFWTVDESFRTSLMHYSIGFEGQAGAKLLALGRFGFGHGTPLPRSIERSTRCRHGLHCSGCRFDCLCDPHAVERQIVLPWSDVLWRVHCDDDVEFRRSRRWSRGRHLASDAKTATATLAQLGTSSRAACRRALAVSRHLLSRTGRTSNGLHPGSNPGRPYSDGKGVVAAAGEIAGRGGFRSTRQGAGGQFFQPLSGDADDDPALRATGGRAPRRAR